MNIFFTPSSDYIRAFETADNPLGIEGSILSRLEFNKKTHLKIATFDSGIGGYLIAAALHQVARHAAEEYGFIIEIAHIGDTKNLPYGMKTGESVVNLTLPAVKRAFLDGADKFFIACNTASVEVERIRAETEKIFPGRAKDIVSVTELSRFRLFRLCDKILNNREGDINILLLATPRTVSSRLYPSFLAAYHGTLYAVAEKTEFNDGFGERLEIPLLNNARINIIQVAPREWVNNIENGASETEAGLQIVKDLTCLSALSEKSERFDIICYFCTHYPFLHSFVDTYLTFEEKLSENAAYVMQAVEAAEYLTDNLPECLKRRAFETLSPQAYPLSAPNIYLTGDRAETVTALITKRFPDLESFPLVRKIML